ANGRDGRLGQPLDAVEAGVETAHGRPRLVRVLECLDVRAGDENARDGAPEHDGPDGIVLFQLRHCVLDLPQEGAVQRVDRRLVEGNDGHRAVPPDVHKRHACHLRVLAGPVGPGVLPTEKAGSVRRSLRPPPLLLFSAGLEPPCTAQNTGIKEPSKYSRMNSRTAGRVNTSPSFWMAGLLASSLRTATTLA